MPGAKDQQITHNYLLDQGSGPHGEYAYGDYSPTRELPYQQAALANQMQSQANLLFGGTNKNSPANPQSTGNSWTPIPVDNYAPAPGPGWDPNIYTQTGGGTTSPMPPSQVSHPGAGTPTPTPSAGGGTPTPGPGVYVPPIAGGQPSASGGATPVSQGGGFTPQIGRTPGSNPEADDFMNAILYNAQIYK